MPVDAVCASFITGFHPHPRVFKLVCARADAAFTVRNLDTGEATTVVLDTTNAAERLSSSLSFGALQRGTSAWEGVRAECRGLLEKLASHSTLSFRSYELCIWQERYVFAEDDALCYQQVTLWAVLVCACHTTA